MSDSGSGSEPPDQGVSWEPQHEGRKYVSPWVPVSMVSSPVGVNRNCESKSEMFLQLAVTTAALAIPLVLLRRQRASASALSKSGSSSMVTSVPPVRRAPKRGVLSTAPPPRAAPALTPASTEATHSVEATSPLQRSSGAPECIANEDSFNGALYSLKAFSIATALVVASGAAGVWGVKTYLGVRDVRHSSHNRRYRRSQPRRPRNSRLRCASRSSPSGPSSPPASIAHQTRIRCLRPFRCRR